MGYFSRGLFFPTVIKIPNEVSETQCGLSRKIFILLYVQYVEKLALDCVINEIKGRRPTK